MTDSSKNGGWLKWVVGIIVVLLVQLLGVAFASGIVWQKLVSVSEQVAGLREYIQQQTADRYSGTEARSDFAGVDRRFGSVEARIGRLEKIHLEANN